jgi:hypothetical protein
MSKKRRNDGMPWALLVVLAAMTAGYLGLWIYFAR